MIEWQKGGIMKIIVLQSLSNDTYTSEFSEVEVFKDYESLANEKLFNEEQMKELIKTRWLNACGYTYLALEHEV